MEYRLWAVGAMATLGFSMPATAASFDCAKAAHPLEHVICDNPAVSKADEAVATAYRAALQRMFDKIGVRNRQREWQAGLRKQCAIACRAQDVEIAYRTRAAELGVLDNEAYEANYKTASVATLRITHLDAYNFDFTIDRGNVDDAPGTPPLCLLPATDDEAGPIARLVTPLRAEWKSGACALSFALRRDPGGHVTAIDVTGTPACRAYCKDGQGLIDDHYLPGG